MNISSPSNLLTLAKNGSQTMPLVWVEFYESVKVELFILFYFSDITNYLCFVYFLPFLFFNDQNNK